MKFKMNRDFTVQGHGHALMFKANEFLHVPEILWSEVRKWGGVSEDGKDITNYSEEEKTSFPTPQSEPQGEDRDNILLDACDYLAKENDSKKFGGNGAPRIDAFTDLVKFRIDATERNKIWKLYNVRKEQERHPSNDNQEDPDPGSTATSNA